MGTNLSHQCGHTVINTSEVTTVVSWLVVVFLNILQGSLLVDIKQLHLDENVSAEKFKPWFYCFTWMLG